jgi:hypothetical protein
MQKIICATLCFVLAFQSFAQDKDYEIATDRPSVSFSAATSPKNILIAETGCFQEKVGNFNILIPNVSLRYGITQRLEARLGGEYLTGDVSESLFLPLTIGLKYRINNPEHEKWSVSALWSSKLPFPSDIENSVLRHSFKGLFQYNVSSKVYTFSNLGVELLKDVDAFAQFSYTLGVGANWTKGLYNYVEVFGYQPFKNIYADTHGANIGIIYIIKNQYQLDASIGGYWDTALRDRLFFNLGFSTYFKMKKS